MPSREQQRKAIPQSTFTRFKSLSGVRYLQLLGWRVRHYLWPWLHEQLLHHDLPLDDLLCVRTERVTWIHNSCHEPFGLFLRLVRRPLPVVSPGRNSEEKTSTVFHSNAGGDFGKDFVECGSHCLRGVRPFLGGMCCYFRPGRLWWEYRQC
jgi:hypothetical protein